MKPSAAPAGCQEGRKALVEPAVVTLAGSPPVDETRPTVVRVWYTLRAMRPSASGVTASTSRPLRSSLSAGPPSTGTRQATKSESSSPAAARWSALPVEDHSTRRSPPSWRSAASVRVSPVAISVMARAARPPAARRYATARPPGDRTGAVHPPASSTSTVASSSPGAYATHAVSAPACRSAVTVPSGSNRNGRSRSASRPSDESKWSSDSVPAGDAASRRTRGSTHRADPVPAVRWAKLPASRQHR